jgi:hypothetical protein
MVREATDKLWRLALDGSSPEPVVEMLASFPIISPDSSMVAFNYFGAPEPPGRGVAVVNSHNGQLLKRFHLDNDDPSDAHVGFRPMGWGRCEYMKYDDSKSIQDPARWFCAAPK